MRFCVCIKQVPDISTAVQTGRMVLNAYDASAVEEALVLKEAHGGTVDLLLVGPETARETIRKALAMGADSATHIVRPDVGDLDSSAVAEILAEHLADHSFDVIATGKQSQDTDSGLAGSMLAERLGLPYASNAVGLAVEGDALVVTRQGDSGQEILELQTPCMVTCSNDMNDPRIPSLKGIMAAKRKSVEQVEISTGTPQTRVEGLEPVPAREPGQLFEGEAGELAALVVDRLVNESGVEL
ncbi:MAG: electron transfer flavoprotein subunit beta/FixA family protein [Rhodothermales bacterium]|nr:electron transfer flavoprotein subunit beta/FixA family protein [Rhodothermales bacterium]